MMWNKTTLWYSVKGHLFQLDNVLSYALLSFWLLISQTDFSFFLYVGVDLPRRTASHLLEEKTACVSAAVSDESVAGDSGVYEASVKQ